MEARVQVVEVDVAQIDAVQPMQVDLVEVAEEMVGSQQPTVLDATQETQGRTAVDLEDRRCNVLIIIFFLTLL